MRAEGWFAGLFNPTPTAWFQSINALAIVALAPFFAWLWTALDRRGIYVTIPFKMAAGIFFLSLSFALMVGAARSEDEQSKVALSALPPSIPLNARSQLSHRDDQGNAGEPFFAGRLRFDAENKQLMVNGALPIVERDRILAQTAPNWFVEEITALKKASEKAESDQPVTVTLSAVPPGFDWSYTNFIDPKTNQVYCTFEPSDRTLTVKRELAARDVLAMQVAASDPDFRNVMNALVQRSSSARVSLWWLFWAYILATFGELCLSPVGLSMVSKLAPAKFATMLMGMWLLTNAFAQFLGGELGEHYGEWTPTFYFVVFFVGTMVASLILFALVKILGKMMHGVR
jgi:POT family proton-dependent oligopeptide transporter